MRNILHIILFEWRSLLRNNTLRLLLITILGTGIYGIYFGKFEIEKQEVRIKEVEDHERQQFDSLLVWAKLDTSLVGNKDKYLKAVSPTGVKWKKHFTYYLHHEKPPLAGLCLGQRDLFPVYYAFNTADLARQMNIAELANPMKLLTGNFDLSYVIIFLMPLFVVALFYNLYAAEKEGGTLSLLRSQPVGLNAVLISKGILRLLIVWILITILLILGFLIQGISISDYSGLFISWLLTSFIYCLVWAILMGIIIRMRFSAAVNAMLGLGTWLIFTLVTPTMINLFVLADKPLPNRSEITDMVRTFGNKTWESPKSFVFDQFYPQHPEYNDGDTTNFNKWYYASFVVLDKKASELKAHFETQVQERNQQAEKWVWLAPAAIIHQKLSQLSGTDRQNHIEFEQRVYAYHSRLKKLYLDRIFKGEQFSVEDLETIQKNL